MIHHHSSPAEVICLAIRLRRSYHPLQRKRVATPPIDGDGRHESVAPASIRTTEKKPTFAMEA
jgi:hypothetical protein